MRVLVVGDFTTAPCGIRNFADQTYRALCNHSGLTVDKWDGHYPELYRRREAGEPTHLPENAATYDVIHVNWHPIAFNTYGPEIFPDGPLLSVYLHDIPPWSGCPFHDRANVRFTSEPSPGCVVLPYPVADWIELPPVDRDFTVGCSTIRSDGVALVADVCEAHGWEFRIPNRAAGWLTFDEEVQRIARNTVNVLWYSEGRGKSGGLSQAISAVRPVVCSDSEMFTHFRAYEDDIYFANGLALPVLLESVYDDWHRGRMKHPTRAALAQSWSNATDQMLAAWMAAA